MQPREAQVDVERSKVVVALVPVIASIDEQKSPTDRGTVSGQQERTQ